MAGKCPRSQVGKKLGKVSGRDRIMEEAHDGRGPQANWEIPVVMVKAMLLAVVLAAARHEL